MELISQNQLAQKLGVSRQYISKLVKKGIFDNCFEGKKLKLDCALKAFEESRKIFSRDSARDKMDDAKKIKAKEVIIKETPIEIKADKEVFNEATIETLAEMIKDIEKPALKVQVIKEYWAGKLNELRYLKEKGKLIDKEEVEREFYEVALTIRERLLNIPVRVASVVLGLKDEFEIRMVLEKELREALRELGEKLKEKDDS